MTPELLSPAGTLTHMRYAFAYGADAVYAGQPRYSLRVRNNDFRDLPNLAAGIEEAHAAGKQFYLAANIAPHNDKVRSFLRDVAPIVEMKPDALIMSDPGLIMLMREKFPEQEIHLSVQANAVNWATVEFWRRQGLSRVILSRELSLEEMTEIRERVPQMEIEVFVHGALCMAYSGRCLLSGYINHRDSNQGACTNACRWKYQAHEGKETETGDIVAAQPIQIHDPAKPLEEQVFLLQEPGRPEELVPVYEDEHGTYIMNSKDLRAVQHVETLVKAGIHSLKIEGRTKSPYYVARTAQVYRRAIDDAVAGRPFDMTLMDVLEGMSSRGFTEGFYRRHPPQEFQNYEQGSSQRGTQQVVGEVLAVGDRWLDIDVKNRFAVGDLLEWMTPAGNVAFQLDGLEKTNGERMEVAPGSGHRVRVPRPEGITGSPEFTMLVRHF